MIDLYVIKILMIIKGNRRYAWIFEWNLIDVTNLRGLGLILMGEPRPDPVKRRLWQIKHVEK